MRPWPRWVGERSLVTRLVLAVAATMAVVLVLGSGFVFWRVQFALDRQVDQDLTAYQEFVERAFAHGERPPEDTPGETYQVYDDSGAVLDGTASGVLVDADTVRRAVAGEVVTQDVGRLLPAAAHPYRVVTTQMTTPTGPVVVATAISRAKHDEALRELLLQLVIADLATLAAAAVVGYRTARSALDPVERYRVAAEQVHPPHLLPVEADRDDEITRLGHTFNALLARISESNERERQFLADAAHELRSPLALMRTELEWALLKPHEPAETQTMLASLRAQVERLITLSNALLDLEEVRAVDDLAATTVPVAAVIDHAARECGSALQEHGRRLEVDAPTGLAVSGNQHWLELALGNLVGNAIRHGAGTVRIRARRVTGGVELAVEDQGPGFPEDFAPYAFDRFSRADRSRASSGTGLGLAMVRAVAEAHGGTAEIAGSRVTLRLPDGPAGAR